MTKSTKNEVLVTITKNDKGEMHAVNAANVATVAVAEIQAAEDIRVHLCFNLMTGNADPAIGAAIKSRKLSTLLGSMARADQNALRFLADKKPADLQTAWAHYVDGAKRVRGISLQGIKSAYNALYGEAKAPKLSAKEQFLAVWTEKMTAKDRALKANQPLYDLAIDFGWEDGSAE